MTVKTDRVEARLSPDERRRIEQAAEFAGESMSSFIVSAAIDRADELISAHTSTVVPSEYFDQLLAALDQPSEPSPRLVATAKRARRQRRIEIR
jgi:uncharacterized protein (DUF1778 family)